MTARKKRPAEADARSQRRHVERVQTGVRIERRLLGVLKALADVRGITLGDLIEGIALHALEGRAAFGPASQPQIRALREAFGLDLTAADSHLLVEREPRSARTRK